MLHLTINDEPHQCAPHTTIAGLLSALKLDPTEVAVERNLEILPKSTYATTTVQAGDRLEIISLIGGG